MSSEKCEYCNRNSSKLVVSSRVVLDEGLAVYFDEDVAPPVYRCGNISCPSNQEVDKPYKEIAVTVPENHEEISA